MKPQERLKKQLPILKKRYRGTKIALQYRSVLDLLVATILSAQCTDARVNMVTKTLFRKYRTAKEYAEADMRTLQRMVRPTGFYRNKARNIVRMARKLVKEHNGRVPKTMADLVALPGVARKTANCVLSTAFHKQEGIVVDTHVLRLSKRLGLSKSVHPEQVERDLMRIVPRRDWGRFAYILQAHGRTLCTARKPKCRECPLSKVCPSAFRI